MIITKQIIIAVLLAAMLSVPCIAGFKVDAEAEKKVDELISKMTVEEKVGQMTQVTLEVVKGEEKDRWLELDEKEAEWLRK